MPTDRAASLNSNERKSPSTAIPTATTNNNTSGTSSGMRPSSPPAGSSNPSTPGNFFPSPAPAPPPSTTTSAPTTIATSPSSSNPAYTSLYGQKSSSGGVIQAYPRSGAAVPTSSPTTAGGGAIGTGTGASRHHHLHAHGALHGVGSSNAAMRDGGFFTRATRPATSGSGGNLGLGNKGNGGNSNGNGGMGIGNFRESSSSSSGGGVMTRALGSGEGSGNISSSSKPPPFGSHAPPRNLNSSPNPELSQNFMSFNLASPTSPSDTPVNLDEIPVPEDLIYDVETFLLFDRAAHEEYRPSTDSPLPQESASSSSSGSVSHPMVCPPGIMHVVRKLWKSMPEHMNLLFESGNLRDHLFAEEKAVAPSKVLHERKIHHEVMGIMGKVTEGNLSKMQTSLMALPIRQSTKEEIKEVINVFFSKSTQPEDSRYTPLYVTLIVYLIENIGSDAGELIRKEIIAQCKENFMSQKQEKNLEESIADLKEEEAELERMKNAAKQKANIYFLGLMFVNKLVTETIICSVLDDLIRPRTRRHRFASDSNLVSFIELLQTCGPHLSTNLDERLTEYREFAIYLKNEHPKIRLRVLFENLLETMDNNWVPVHGRLAKREPAPIGTVASASVSATNALRSNSPNSPSNLSGGIGASPNSPGSPLNMCVSSSGGFLRPGAVGGAGCGGGGMGGVSSSAGGSNSGAPSGSTNSFLGKGNDSSTALGVSTQEASVETQEEFWKAMDDCFSTWRMRGEKEASEEKEVSEELKSIIQNRLPPELVLAYCSSAIGRYISSLRCNDERMNLGRLFQEMIHEGIIPPDVPEKAILLTIEAAIEDDTFGYLPGYFSCWNTVIRHGGNIFPASLNTTFLERLVAHHCSPQDIERFIEEVDSFVDHETEEAGGPGHTSGKSTVSRPTNTTSTKASATNNNLTAGSGALHGSPSSSSAQENTLAGRGGTVDDCLRDRLRLLPSVLRCAPPLLCDEITARKFQDPLQQLGVKSIEVKAFRFLVEDSTNEFGNLTNRVIKENPFNALPLLSALFTYIRFNVGPLFELHKTKIKKILNSASTIPFVKVIEEVYLQWKSLDSPLEQFTSFYECMKKLSKVDRPTDERLRERLQKGYPPSESLQKVLNYLKSPSGPTSPTTNLALSSSGSSCSSSSGANGTAAAPTPTTTMTAPAAPPPPGGGSGLLSRQGLNGSATFGRGDAPAAIRGSPVKVNGALPPAPQYSSPNLRNPIDGGDFCTPAGGNPPQRNANLMRGALPSSHTHQLAPPASSGGAGGGAGKGGRGGRVSSSPNSFYNRAVQSPPQQAMRVPSISSGGRGGGGAGHSMQQSSRIGQSNGNGAPPPPPPTSTTTTTATSNHTTVNSNNSSMKNSTTSTGYASGASINQHHPFPNPSSKGPAPAPGSPSSSAGGVGRTGSGSATTNKKERKKGV